MASFAVSLPVSGGKLNCTVKRPTQGLVKQFRQAARKVVELTAKYSAAVDELVKASQSGDPDIAAKEAALDANDVASYEAINEQACLVLTIVSMTPDDPNTPFVAVLDDVLWDEVETTTVQGITNFFQTSISG